VLGVVPAKAGTHNHGMLLPREVGAPACPNNCGRWLMEWTAPYGISVPE